MYALWYGKSVSLVLGDIDVCMLGGRDLDMLAGDAEMERILFTFDNNSNAYINIPYTLIMLLFLWLLMTVTYRQFMLIIITS